MDDRLQQQRLVFSIPKPVQSAAVVGHDSEGYRKGGRNGTVPGINVKVGGALRTTVCKQEMDGDRGYVQGLDGIPPSSGATDYGDDG